MAIKLEGYHSNLDRGASRAKELLWLLAKHLLFTPPWPLPSGLRCWLLRRFGAQVGQGVVIRSGVNITFPWRLKAGNHVWIGEGAVLLNLAEIEIEDNCCISQRAFLCTGSHDFRQPGFDLIVKPIHIKSGSWVAAQAFIGPGVEVGPDAMVCAGSVATRQVPPSCIVRGNPAEVVKERRAASSERRAASSE